MKDIAAKDKSSFQRRGIFITKGLPEKKHSKRNPFAPLKQVGNVTNQTRKKMFPTKKRTFLTAGVILILLGAGVGYDIYQRNILQNPYTIYTQKVKDMTTQAGKFVALPKDEDPVIATVTDKNHLPNEIFFKQAQDGDKILLYKKHKEAVLYRPATQQVITYATLDFRNISPTPVPQGIVAGASTSAQITATASAIPTQIYHPQGKILVAPQE